VFRQFVSRFTARRLCLIADSSLVIRKAASSILSDLRFRIAEADNGADALIQCRERTPDAILIDGAMARSDGFDILRALAERGTGHQPKIIFCTAERDPAQIARAIEAGAHEYVVKPFDRSILTAKFEKLGLTI
jgi:two-component system, chemotaxis family, chemotaxis protein CheY